MLEENNLKNALQLISVGRRGEASRILLNIYKRTTNQDIKLQVILALIVSLNQIEHNKLLIQLCNEGIKIAAYLQPNTQGYLMANKAIFLINHIALLIYRKSNLKLAPGWLGFSTEAEKHEFEELNRQITSGEHEVDNLIEESLKIANGQDKKSLQGHIYHAIGKIYGSKYFNYNLEYAVQNRKITWLSNHYLIRRFNLYKYLIYSRGQRKKLNESVALTIENLLEAVQLFKDAGNEPSASYALFDLSMQLKNFNRFRKASKYLATSKTIAEKHNDAELLRNIDVVGRSIKMRNTDIPNYLEGESRNI